MFPVEGYRVVKLGEAEVCRPTGQQRAHGRENTVMRLRKALV